MSHAGYHEPHDELSAETRDMHRAIESLMEELEAVDWYNQRVVTCKDSELRKILQHNADEEKEHAAMVLEWIRRRDAKLDKHLRTYLFTDKSILDIEEESEHGESEPDSLLDKVTQQAESLVSKAGKKVSTAVLPLSETLSHVVADATTPKTDRKTGKKSR